MGLAKETEKKYLGRQEEFPEGRAPKQQMMQDNNG